jgi:ubiquinone/menaquinone biosynthesis C-methylase UbiE
MPTLMVPGRFFAATYDKMNAAVEQEFGGPRRRALLAALEGSVIEIGAGTGANVEHYPDAVSRLVLTEPDRHMRAKLVEKLDASGRSAEVVGAGAQSLPFEDGTFDAAVVTLVLCTVPDPAAGVREIRRVLRPGGRLLFVEHVRSEHARTARVQDLIRPLWKVIGRGCHPNRDTLATIRGGGFEVDDVERVIVPKIPSFVHEAIIGSAHRP